MERCPGLPRVGALLPGRNLVIANELDRAKNLERWLNAGSSGAILFLLVTLWQASAIRNVLARAREATKLKSEFLTNVNHEIRTPMNVIGMAALAQDTPDPVEQQEYLNDVITSSESLLAL